MAEASRKVFIAAATARRAIAATVSGGKHAQDNLRVQQHSATGERARVY